MASSDQLTAAPEISPSPSSSSSSAPLSSSCISSLPLSDSAKWAICKDAFVTRGLTAIAGFGALSFLLFRRPSSRLAVTAAGVGYVMGRTHSDCEYLMTGKAQMCALPLSSSGFKGADFEGAMARACKTYRQCQNIKWTEYLPEAIRPKNTANAPIPAAAAAAAPVAAAEPVAKSE